MEETTSFKMERNVEILWMHLSSRLVAEIVSTNNLLLLTKLLIVAIGRRDWHYQIGKKCENFMDAFIKWRSY